MCCASGGMGNRIDPMFLASARGRGEPEVGEAMQRRRAPATIEVVDMLLEPLSLWESRKTS